MIPSLHVPDEPMSRCDEWVAAVHAGRDLADVLGGEGGFTEWLWSRWSALAASGISREEFATIVLGYRRELWLWMAGERTWVQACSGLVGRVKRRAATVAAAVG